MTYDEMSLIFDEAVQKRAFAPVSLFKRPLNLTLFSNILSRLLGGGIPLLQALQVLKDAFPDAAEKQLFKEIREGIRQGRSFSQVLSDEPVLFPDYFVQMVRAGEASGTLETVLKRMAEEFEKQERIKRKIQEAVAYPLLILALGLVTLYVILKRVLPKLALLYGDMGSQLPAATRFILALSDLFFPLLGLFAAGCLLLLWVLKKKRGKNALLLFLNFPMFGSLIQKIFLNRFSSFLSLLLKSGIPVLQALEMMGKEASADFFRRDLIVLRESLSEGRGFTGSLKDAIWIDRPSLALIRAGEESGRLDESLAEIAEASAHEIDFKIQVMLKLLEPLLILAVGGIVGMIVIGTILPVFEMNGLVK